MGVLSAPGRWRVAVAGIAAGVVVGGTVAVVAPAVATQDASYAATNWKKIWKKNLKKYADKRYYTKKQANAKYAAKTDLGNYWTKAQSDAAYAGKATVYTKGESDAKYAPYPTVIRGAFALIDTASAANQTIGEDVSFGVNLSAAPTVHVIAPGALPPPGCSGTLAAPNAQAGNLCIFQRVLINSSPVVTCQVTNVCGNTANTYGAWLLSNATAAGYSEVSGSWALRPAAINNAASPDAQGGGGGSARAGQ